MDYISNQKKVKMMSFAQLYSAIVVFCDTRIEGKQSIFYMDTRCSGAELYGKWRAVRPQVAFLLKYILKIDFSLKTSAKIEIYFFMVFQNF